MAEAAVTPKAPTTAPEVRNAPVLNPVERIQKILLAERDRVAENQPHQTQTPPGAKFRNTETGKFAAEAEVKAAQAKPEEAPPEEEYQPQPNTQVEGEQPQQADAPAVEIPLDQLEAIELETTYKGDDGSDVTSKLPIKELKKGYMLQKDYSRKTAELARQREQVADQVRQAVESERTQYMSNLQQIQTTLIETTAPELKDVNWNHLATNDPAEYVRLRNRADQIQQVLNGIQSKQAEVTSKQKAEQAQARQKAANEAREVLEKKIPTWSDDLYKSLMKTASEYGYKLEEVANWVDPKAFEVLHDAHQYRQMKAEKPAVEKRVSVPPKVVKPGAAAPATAAQLRASDAMSRLQKSGNISDAAAVIKSRLG